jgi:hypothetical protein
MSVFSGPEIVNDGLVLSIDAGNTKSYPGTGTAWNDLSNSLVNGTLANGPTFATDVGGAISLDGVDDVINFGTTSIMNLTSGLTLEVWFNITSFGGGNFGRLFDRDQGTNTGYIFFVDNTISNGTNALRYVSNGVGSSVNNIVSLNTWVCGLVTHIGTTVNIYTNGVFRGISTHPSMGNPSGGVTNLTVGNNAANNRQFNGKIALARAYNRVLTNEEILKNFNANRGRFSI